MPSEEEIIIIGGGQKPPPVKQNSEPAAPPVEVTVKPQGLARLRDVVKQYSTWVLLFIVAAPELYTAAHAAGLVGEPGNLTTALRGLAAAGLAVKFIRQTRPVPPT